jgi:hypothetical protein
MGLFCTCARGPGLAFTGAKISRFRTTVATTLPELSTHVLQGIEDGWVFLFQGSGYVERFASGSCSSCGL